MNKHFGRSKKGKMILVEMVQLILVLMVIVALVSLIYKFINLQESQTMNSFKTIRSEVKLMADDLDDIDKTEITVPVFVEKEYALSSSNPNSDDHPPKCKEDSCLILFERDTQDVIEVLKLEDIEFEQEEHIYTSKDSIIKILIKGENVKEGEKEKKIITLSMVSD